MEWPICIGEMERYNGNGKGGVGDIDGGKSPMGVKALGARITEKLEVNVLLRYLAVWQWRFGKYGDF